MSLLNEKYSRDAFISFLKKELVPDYTPDIRSVEVNGKSLLKQVFKLGGSPELGITIFEAYCDESDHGKRIAITQDAFRMLRDTATRNAIIVFHADNSSKWRLSLLTSTFELSDNGKIVSKVSNPRRFSYLLGVGAKVSTPYKYLVKQGPVIDLLDLQKRFSVEVVNKEFYSSIADLYTKLVGGKRKKGSALINYPGLLTLKGKTDQSVEHQEFAVRLIGRLVFCWFLREKKSSRGTSLVPEAILSAEAANTQNYYHEILEPLFFEVLDRKPESRKNQFSSTPYSLIPYLNGGLFSPQAADYYLEGQDLVAKHYDVSVPDEWLMEFTELLDSYSFTVDENTSYNVDLAVDPEMLGRIFENLLAEINPETGESARKSTGSFYTPREVVEYMVDRSLVYYLENKTNIQRSKIEALVSYGTEDDNLQPLSSIERKNVLDSLGTLTILDPACGSGAYPIGVLQKVVYILQQVDEDAHYWLESQLEGISPELRRHLEDKHRNQNYNYLRKLGVIRKSIFGVDIQPIATEISRLRCFLTLIVDESVNDEVYNRGIEPLPNLDFKFVTANTLLYLPNQEDARNGSSHIGSNELFEDSNDIEALRRIRDEYFSAPPESRLVLQSKFSSLQTDMAHKNMDLFKGSGSKRYDSLSRWKPFEHKLVDWFSAEWMFGVEKFDIVISNPPYVGESGHKDLFQRVADSPLGKRFYQGKMDYFYFFIHLALDHLLEGGVLTFITTNYYVTATGAKKLIRDIQDRSTILELINFNELKIFESALGQHNLITSLKRGHFGTDAYAVSTSHRGFLGSSVLASIIDGSDPKTSYFHIEQSQLYKNDNIQLSISPAEAILDKIAKSGIVLRDVCDINQGIVTGANKVTESNKRKYDLEAEVGDGIFVFTSSQIKDFDLRKNLAKPWYKNSDIKRYVVSEEPIQYVVLTNFITNLDDEGSFGKYIKKYKKLLENRSQIEHCLDWWDLHQIRMKDKNKTGEVKKMIFDSEKIVAPQRSKRNTFGYTTKPWYGASDVYFIVNPKGKYSLKALTGILNSKLIYIWLYNRGKKKGESLELFTDPLAKIPLPEITTSNTEVVNKIVRLVDKIRSSIEYGSVNSKTPEEDMIDRLVYDLYDLSEEEKLIIEQLN